MSRTQSSRGQDSPAAREAPPAVDQNRKRPWLLALAVLALSAWLVFLAAMARGN